MTVLKHLQRIMNGALYFVASVLFALASYLIWNQGIIMYTDRLAFKYSDLRAESEVALEIFKGYYFDSFATPVFTLISYLLIVSAVLFAVAAIFWLLVIALPSDKACKVFTSFGNIFYHLAFEALIAELLFWIVAAVSVHLENGSDVHPEMIHTHAFIFFILIITASVVIKILSNFTLRLQKVYEENLAIAQAEAEDEADGSAKRDACEAEATVTDDTAQTSNSEETVLTEDAAIVEYTATADETETADETATSDETATADEAETAEETATADETETAEADSKAEE